MPAIHLDLYVIRDSDPLAWRFDDLSRAIDTAQLGRQRPVIVEGVLLLRALRAIGRAPDFLILVDKEDHQSSMRQRVHSYFAEEKPGDKAAYVLKWSSAAHDARVLRAHHASRDREEI
jgi:hypothetical protein